MFCYLMRINQNAQGQQDTNESIMRCKHHPIHLNSIVTHVANMCFVVVKRKSCELLMMAEFGRVVEG